MEKMRRKRYSLVAAVLASLALMAALPAPCHCMPEPAAAAEHACCAPPSGYQVANPGCCPAADVAPLSATALPGPPPAATPVLVVVAQATLAPVPAFEPSQASPVPAAPPPLTVRRL
jgi:hypothetical protein